MSRKYRLGMLRRAGNVVIRRLIASGLGPRRYVLLTVAGRRTGVPRTTPVRLFEFEGRRWLVAPYGAVQWVRNARAAGEVRISRGRKSFVSAVVESDQNTAAPVLRAYARSELVTRPYFDARPSDPVDRFAAEAERHPVFQLAE